MPDAPSQAMIMFIVQRAPRHGVHGAYCGRTPPTSRRYVDAFQFGSGTAYHRQPAAGLVSAEQGPAPASARRGVR